MRVDFYQLSAAPLERVLPAVCEKVLGRGERLVVVAREPLLARLDAQLWAYAPDSFLPHGRKNPQHQPILLSSSAEPLNGAINLAIADGEWRDEALGFARIFYFFDASSLDTARGAWRHLKEVDGAEPHYWKQEDGKWIEGP
jgi:DNA polymerase III subunit chi